MLRDGLNTSLNFSEYIKSLSETEAEDLNIKLNSCGYQSSDSLSDLLNTIELFIEDQNLSKEITKENLWNELLNNGYVLGDRILQLQSPPLYGADVEELQEYLSRLGFFSDPINSIFNNNLEVSVKHFQENRGLSVDGVVGMDTSVEIRKFLRPNMGTSLNEAVKSFKRDPNTISICFDVDNVGDYKEQNGFYQELKTHCTEMGISVYFSSEVNQNNNEENVVSYVNKLNPSLFLKFAFKESDVIINHFEGKHSLSIIGEQLSSKIGTDEKITSQGKSLPILKKTKSVALIFNGNFYQFNIKKLITDIISEIKDIYKN
jgi:peptidoglycan hydrolase-like protein with peptidoglycan-binding domain